MGQNPPEHQPAISELGPARMVNAYAYCPRLCYLEWVRGEFAGSADTVDGRLLHRRVDAPSGDLMLPESGDDGEPERTHARSVTLFDDRLGVIARMDLVEDEGKRATSVD